MSRDFWYLFSRDLKIPILVLVGFILLGFAFSWVLAGYGIGACLLFIYFRLRDRIQKIYCFFIFLSEELVYRKRLNLEEVEEELFLYGPCNFLINRYCVEYSMAVDERYIQYFTEESLPEVFRCMMGLTGESFRRITQLTIFVELLLPIFLAVIFYFIFHFEIAAVIGTLALVYFIIYVPPSSFSQMINRELFRMDRSIIERVIKPDYYPSNKKWKVHYEKWKDTMGFLLLSIPFEMEISAFEKALYKWRIREKKFDENFAKDQLSEKEIAQQIYDQIDEKIEAAELTSQELWDLWAEYYFEGYEAKE